MITGSFVTQNFITKGPQTLMEQEFADFSFFGKHSQKDVSKINVLETFTAHNLAGNSTGFLFSAKIGARGNSVSSAENSLRFSGFKLASFQRNISEYNAKNSPLFGLKFSAKSASYFTFRIRPISLHAAKNVVKIFSEKRHIRAIEEGREISILKENETIKIGTL